MQFRVHSVYNEQVKPKSMRYNQSDKQFGCAKNFSALF